MENKYVAQICFSIITKRVIILCGLIFTLITPSWANSELKNTVNAYCYLKFIQKEVDYLIQKNPPREIEIRKAYSRFNLVYRTSLENMEKHLKLNLTENESFKLSIKIDSTLESFKYLFDYSDLGIALYVNELDSRAKGNIPSQFLQTILYYQYIDNPASELTDDFYDIVDLNKFSKEYKPNISIKLPKSWKKKKGRRKGVVLNAISNGGNGLQMVIIQVTPLGGATAQDKKGFFDNKLKDILPIDAKFLNYIHMIFDSQHKGGMVEYDLTIQQLDLVLQNRNKYFCFIYKNNLISVGCSVAKYEKTQNLESEMEIYNHLFFLIINSIVTF